MKPKTTPTIEEKEVNNKMQANADSEIIALHTEQQAAQQRLSEIDSELAVLATQVTQRNTNLVALRSQVTQTRTVHIDAAAYAKVAVDTPGERNSVVQLKEAEQRLHDLEQQLKDAEEQATKDTEADQARVAVLTSERRQLVQRLDEIPLQVAALERHKQELHTQLGQMLRDESHARLAALKDVSEQRQRELHEALQQAQEKLSEAIRQEIETLEGYPEQNDLKLLLPVDDTLTCVLERYLALLNTFIDEGAKLPQRLDLPGILGGDMWLELFVVTIGNLSGYGGIRDGAKQLRQKREDVAAILQRYRRSKQL